MSELQKAQVSSALYSMIGIIICVLSLLFDLSMKLAAAVSNAISEQMPKAEQQVNTIISRIEQKQNI